MGNKYPILKPNEIISALSKKGFVFKSQKGSHAKYKLDYPIALGCMGIIASIMIVIFKIRRWF